VSFFNITKRERERASEWERERGGEEGTISILAGICLCNATCSLWGALPRSPSKLEVESKSKKSWRLKCFERHTCAWSSPIGTTWMTSHFQAMSQTGTGDKIFAEKNCVRNFAWVLKVRSFFPVTSWTDSFIIKVVWDKRHYLEMISNFGQQKPVFKASLLALLNRFLKLLFLKLSSNVMYQYFRHFLSINKEKKLILSYKGHL